IARDRVGVRPLFYTIHHGRFIFASEIKSLLEFGGVRAEISPRVMSQILTFWTAKSPETVFRDIYEVPPGYYFKLNADGIQQKKFWELPFRQEADNERRTLDEVSEEFRELFSDAVRIRLRADVPVGAYLSGGIDSSVTTAFIKAITPGNLRTFSIGFNDAEYDETAYQNLVKDYLGTRHTHLKCSAAEIAGIFPDVVWHAESPLLRTAPGPMFLLSELVRRENFKVVITGEGADEFLGGYDIFKEALIREFWSRDQESKMRPSLLRRLYPYMPQMTNANLAILKLFFGYKLDQVNSPAYSHLLRWNNTSRIKNYLSDDFKDQIGAYDPVSEILSELDQKFRGTDLLSRAQALEINLFMSGYLLSSQGDRMAMGNSVEGRYPFLDYRVMEFCMNLPRRYKIRGLNEKILLKHMMSGKLPDQIIRRPKQPYRAPILNSFFSPDAPDYIPQMLSPAQVLGAGIFDPESVSALHAKMRSGKGISETDSMAITAILSAQLMDHLFIRRSDPLKEADLPGCIILTTEDHSLINNPC
ncbi:MAG TPA: asparagine synthase (glutamine-hydrolyzing), partial [Sphingobacteriaceae bacterium]